LRYSWYPYSRRPRSRLRKRKNIPYCLGFYRFGKYYSDTSTKSEGYDKDRILESGFTVGETWGFLDKAWVGFRAAKRLENNKDMRLYASIIQRLEKELHREVNDFPEFGLCVCEIEKDGFEVRLGKLKKIDEEYKQKGVDGLIAIDMLSKAYEDHYDIAILITGDEDFHPIVRSVKDTGKRVFGVFFDKHFSADLEKDFDRRYVFTKDWISAFRQGSRKVET
jgi:hypothetical protein